MRSSTHPSSYIFLVFMPTSTFFIKKRSESLYKGRCRNRTKERRAWSIINNKNLVRPASSTDSGRNRIELLKKLHPDCVFNNASVHKTIIQEKCQFESIQLFMLDENSISFCLRESASCCVESERKIEGSDRKMQEN